MKIAIASDHRGYKLKSTLISYLKKKNYEIIDVGTDSTAPVDYPIYAFKLGNIINGGYANLGIVICGTGIGVSIACNKVKNIRCAKVDNPEEARLARLHNDANIIALNGSIFAYKAKDIVDEFLKVAFSNEERHIRRIKMINDYENGDYNER